MFILLTTSALIVITGILLSEPSGGPNVISVTLYILLTASFWIIPSFFWKASSAQKTSLSKLEELEVQVKGAQMEDDFADEKTIGDHLIFYISKETT